MQHQAVTGEKAASASEETLLEQRGEGRGGGNMKLSGRAS